MVPGGSEEARVRYVFPVTSRCVTVPILKQSATDSPMLPGNV